MELLVRSQQTFFCPFGHQQHFCQDQGIRGQLDAVRRERDRLKQIAAQKDDDILAERERGDRANARADHNANSARAYKGVATKLKKRVVNGVCPCCNRHFRELESHMRTKHPDFPKAAIVEGVDGAVH